MAEDDSELYRRYRPKSLKGLIGQPGVVATLEGFFADGRVPHCILLSGGSGCGKTTIARIIRKRIGAGERDYSETNAASFRGIDTVREIEANSRFSPLDGPARLYVIDECHQLTTQAQNAILKILEDPPPHAYFVLCTTDPQRLLKTILTRSTEIKVSPLSPADVVKLVNRVAKAEGRELSEEVAEAIAESAEGSARKALVMLQAVLAHEAAADQLSALTKASAARVAGDLGRAIFSGAKWSEISRILADITDEPETVRRAVLGYARAILLKGGKNAEFAFAVIDVFRDHVYDSGAAGLAACCWEISSAGKK